MPVEDHSMDHAEFEGVIPEVATPIEWDELGRVESKSFTIANVERRLSRMGDPWRGLWRHARSLGEPRRRLDRLLAEAEG